MSLVFKSRASHLGIAAEGGVSNLITKHARKTEQVLWKKEQSKYGGEL